MRQRRLAVASVALFWAAVSAYAENTYVYIGDITSTTVLIAWGNTSGQGNNTIGRGSAPLGQAQVKIADRTLTSDKNWIQVTDLKPDTDYPYEVLIDGKRIGGNRVRTNPAQADKVCFFVIGDYGSGRPLQYRVADVMKREFERRRNSDNPVRFILSMGDNIYGEVSIFGVSKTGKNDRDWDDKFFKPYSEMLQAIPFHPVLGNHDGNETESREDLTTYLDNFYFPNNEPARYYEFNYANLIDFFALDSTKGTLSGGPTPAYGPESAQTAWLRQHLAASKAPWKIPYFHHPTFSAGPLHPSSINVLRHWVDMFSSSGVKVVFAGHEHNFQFTDTTPNTFGIRFVVSGAGGELRPADIRSGMASNNILAGAAQAHFCVVEIEGKNMRITPMSFTAMDVRDVGGRQVPMPVTVALP